MNGCSFRQMLRQKFRLVFVLTLENALSSRFHFKAKRKSMDYSKNSTRDFQNSPPFERLACFYVTTTRNSDCIYYFIFETNFLEKRKIFSKNLNIVFSSKY